MNFVDILIFQGISTVIAIAKTADGKSKYRAALLKVFKTIAMQFADDKDFQTQAALMLHD